MRAPLAKANMSRALSIFNRMKIDKARDMFAFASGDRKSTRLNSSHLVISYAVFCLKNKKVTTYIDGTSQCVYLNDYIPVVAPPGTGPSCQWFNFAKTFTHVKPLQSRLDRLPASSAR